MLYPADKKTNSSQPLSRGTEFIDKLMEGVIIMYRLLRVDTICPSAGGFGKWVIFTMSLHCQGVTWTTQEG